VQSGLHPILSVELLSSHSSEVTRILSPHINEQFDVPFTKVYEQLKPVNAPEHIVLQPLLSDLFPSSHVSDPSMSPSPHMGEQVVVVPEFVQSQPGFDPVQVLLQPIPPSSHVSSGFTL